MLALYGPTFFRENQFDYRGFNFRVTGAMRIPELMSMEAILLDGVIRIMWMQGNRILSRDHVED